MTQVPACTRGQHQARRSPPAGRWRRAASALLCVCTVPAFCTALFGCGPAQTQRQAQEATAPSDTPTDDAAISEAPTEAAPPSIARADCSDGTCFPCGEGECPQGAYCDRDSPAGPACAWLTECAGKATCACIQRVLGAGCQCDNADGPSVMCTR